MLVKFKAKTEMQTTEGREIRPQDWLMKATELISTLNETNADQIYKEFCQLARAVEPLAVEAFFASNPDGLAYSTILAEADYNRTVCKDTKEIQRLLDQRWAAPVSFRDVASPPAVALYDRVADVFGTLSIDGCRRVCVVGCGMLPGTMFHFHDRISGAEIVGLDIDQDSVDAANTLAAKLGYEHIKVVLCDGREYDYADVDAVFVARMVRGKKQVLSRIAETAPPDVWIVMRDPLSLARLWSENGERDLGDCLQVVSRGPAGGFGALSRNVYVKRRAAP